MSDIQERVLNRLTSSKRGTIVDVKFAPGMSRFISHDEFCHAVESAIRQLEAGCARTIENIDGSFTPRTVEQFLAK